VAGYRSGELSPVQVTKDTLERIERLNDTVNAYGLLDPAGALDAARLSEQRWLRGEPVGVLDGVPISIKDTMLTEGWPMLRGSYTVDKSGP
jgi:aspartyl-tRNA(Asn)/glutamyl-tRNA(Gln) amidotransferase subunit A